jgi:hypothetical protein
MRKIDGRRKVLVAFHTGYRLVYRRGGDRTDASEGTAILAHETLVVVTFEAVGIRGRFDGGRR